ELSALRALAGAADDAELETAIECSQQRRDAMQASERLAAELAAQGDGRDEAALRDEAIGQDPDAAVARLHAIGDERREQDARREHLAAERTRLQAELAAMERGRDAASCAQAAQQALADAAGAAERYARLHVARTLLQSGIERFRREQQGPLLRRAGQHFSALTGGRYAGLVLGEDGGRTVMLGLRDDGTECPLDALSEGARDQLYLALRAAIVEAHAAQAEALPFIADDLLVHFDDARAAAALRMLATLGQSTQVILFTHHEHIATLASRERAAAVEVVRFGEGAAAALEVAAD
ncbi:MAG: hypothetical protein JOY70_05310, partial [Acidisphaera sp.]|nr:hypothetical protein [Acidisphaera sp.]